MLGRSRASAHPQEAPGCVPHVQEASRSKRGMRPGGERHRSQGEAGLPTPPPSPLSRAIGNTQEGLSKYLLNECSVKERDAASRELQGPARHCVPVTFLMQ